MAYSKWSINSHYGYSQDRTETVKARKRQNIIGPAGTEGLALVQSTMACLLGKSSVIMGKVPLEAGDAHRGSRTENVFIGRLLTRQNLWKVMTPTWQS